jgi:hypothetical protein
LFSLPVIAGLAHEMVGIFIRGQEFGMMNHDLIGEVVKRSLDLTGEHLNTLQALMISHPWVEVHPPMKEGVSHKQALLKVTHWVLLCLIISMDHLCVDYQVACLCLICQGHPKCSCLFLVLGKWSYDANTPSLTKVAI